jgi:hypothetical protein
MKEVFIKEILKFRDSDGNFIEFSGNEKTLRIVAGNEDIGRNNCYAFVLNSPQCDILREQITSWFEMGSL